MTFDSVQSLARRMAELGASKLYVKELASNDNTKNQIYLGPSFGVLQLLPFGNLRPSLKSTRAIMHADLQLSWVGGADLGPAPAPSAKLVLYPQYPEVRMSGFVDGAVNAPSEWLDNRRRGRAEGRVLFLGVADDGKIHAHLGIPDSPLARSYDVVKGAFSLEGVLRNLTSMLVAQPKPAGGEELFGRLKQIHLKGWIESKRLYKDGILRPCTGTNCGGVTLEAELGISSNGRSEPDFQGWEIKQHAGSNPVTLFTPEPDGGEYIEGVEEFVESYGSPSKKPNVRYFRGRHFADELQESTGMTLKVVGYDTTAGRITDANGGLVLLHSSGAVAASWSFQKILTHWCRKHNKAAYVPSEKDKTSTPAHYRYGKDVRLCRGTDPCLLLAGVSKGVVYYDPGIRHDLLADKVKPRSQFRTSFSNLATLYLDTEEKDVTVS